MKAVALIAEDEPLLAQNLQAELARLWPELQICANVGDGQSAVTHALARQPDLMFLDIRMPGLSGIDAAQSLADEWPDAGKPFPLIVFVTAYDQYAVQAFERAAIDYLVKPVQADRLAQTCRRLQASLQQRAQPAAAELTTGATGAIGTIGTTGPLDAAIQQLKDLLLADAAQAKPASVPLRMLQAGCGNTINMVPVDDVLYFDSADKYVRVVTMHGEHWIRMSLRELEPQLDAQRFWKIHRSTIVRCDAISSVVRNDFGKLTVYLKNHPDRLAVSRLYTHLFKPA